MKKQKSKQKPQFNKILLKIVFIWIVFLHLPPYLWISDHMVGTTLIFGKNATILANVHPNPT